MTCVTGVKSAVTGAKRLRCSPYVRPELPLNIYFADNRIEDLMAKNSLLTLLAITGLLGLVLGGCASTPDVYSQVAPGSDFRNIKTYAFIAQASTDKAGYQSLETNMLKVAVAGQLDARGLSYDPQNPDVVLNFFILTDEKIKARQTPTMAAGGYYGYRGGFYDGFGPGMGVGMGYETTIQQYTEGTLTIDLIDPRERKLLWEGTVKGRVTKKDVKNMEATIEAAVAEIFTRFPVLDAELAQ